jgi:glycosyltransferase involved in cell wall biosynthesis
MKLTVAIPSYRRQEDLRRALEALTKQERPADAVIVVARKSDTETHAVVREFMSKLPLALHLVERPGVVEAYNRAMDVVTGDVISFIDDDAAPHPDWARKIVQTFGEEPDLAGLGGRDHILQHGEWIEGAEPVVGIVHWYGRAIGHHHLGVGPKRDVDTMKAVNMSLRVNALGQLRMDRRLRGTGAQWHCEMKLCLDLRAQGKRLAYDPSIVVDHFASARYDEDQRDSFVPLAYENEIHNLTLTLLEYLRPVGRMILLPYALAVGVGTSYFGVLQGLRYWPKIGNVAWRKVAASARGVRAGWKTWRNASRIAS